MPGAAGLPVGTVTFLFTDIEGSTRLAQALGDAWDGVVEAHDRLIRSAVEERGGTVVRSTGDGFFAVFPDAPGGVAAASGAARGLADRRWPGDVSIRVRMGLHSGVGRLGGGDYVGLDVHRAARIADAGHGGQILVSAATKALAEHALPEGATLRELGSYRLKGLDHPERLFELVLDGLTSGFPPPRTAGAAAGGLPEDRTSFIGREGDVEDLLAALGEARLVTLTGPGGTGKTRLALQAARGAEVPADRAWFVDLSSVREAALVAPAIARELAVQPDGSTPVVDALVERLAGRRALLVLDNFEQVVDAADLVRELVGRLPELTILVTSRVPLRLSGEREIPVEPMALPEGEELDAMAQSDAVRLFLARARSVGREVSLEDDGAVVRELCVRLEGLPLAIELAASRTKLLSPRAILDRLGRRLDVPAARARDVPERQRTLRATIAWSEELLEEPHRRLLAALSVFAGGWTIEAAEAVCGPATGGMDLEEGIELLLEHSLVRQRSDRFDMLETIRAYGLERLAERGWLEETAERHAVFFRELVESAEPHLTRQERHDWTGRLEADEGNLRTALRWAVSSDRGPLASSMVAGLWRFWQIVGRGAEGAGWAEEVVALPSSGGRTRERCLALLARGNLVYWLGDLPVARSSYEEALAIARELDEEALEAEALYDLGYAHIWSEEPDRAGRAFSESAAIREAQGDRVGHAWTQTGMAMVHGLRRDHDAMLPLLREAEAVFHDAGDVFGLENVLGVLATIEFERGELDRAEERVRKLLASTHVEASTAAGLSAMANIALARGDAARAVRLWGAVEAIADAAGGGSIPSVLVPLGDTREEAASALDPQVAAAATAEGRSMGPREAIAYALGETD